MARVLPSKLDIDKEFDYLQKKLLAKGAASSEEKRLSRESRFKLSNFKLLKQSEKERGDRPR
jgi:hypothetical protein